MKKLIVMILIVALVVGAAAFAEDWQAKFADYSLEDLQALAAAADAEIIRRTAESFDVPTGTYIIGEDIPAGTYRLDYIKNSVIVKVWKNQAATQKEYNWFFSEVISKDSPTIGKLVLEKGNIIYLDDPARFSLYKGIMSW